MLIGLGDLKKGCCVFNLGLSEIILISVIALIFIGPKQLPEIARALGKAINELKRASEDLTSSITNPKNFNKSIDEKREKAEEKPLDSLNHQDPSLNHQHGYSVEVAYETEETKQAHGDQDKGSLDEEKASNDNKKADS